MKTHLLGFLLTFCFFWGAYQIGKPTYGKIPRQPLRSEEIIATDLLHKIGGDVKSYYIEYELLPVDNKTNFVNHCHEFGETKDYRLDAVTGQLTYKNAYSVTFTELEEGSGVVVVSIAGLGTPEKRYERQVPLYGE